MIRNLHTFYNSLRRFRVVSTLTSAFHML
jgi:hypothetical protein